MVQTFAYSTEDLGARDRYSLWQDSVSRNLNGMTLGCPKEQQPKFWARMKGARVAGGAVLEIERTGDIAHRSQQDIHSQPSDNLLIYRAAQTPSWFRPHGDQEFVAASGAIVVGYADVPFSQAPIGGVDYSCVLVSLPLHHIGAFRPGRRVALPQTIPVDRGLGALLLCQLDALNQNLPYLSAEAVEIACGGLAQLAALAQGSIGSRDEAARSAIADGHVAAAERLMASRAHRPDLTPEAVADRLGIPVRRLHALLEPTGKTFSQRLRTLRLARARSLLTEGPDLPVIDIAFRCGFDNLPTFYRPFKAAFGMTATEYRDTARKNLPDRASRAD